MSDGDGTVRRARLQRSRRLRATPYTERVEALGVSDYSVVNHTILPKAFGRSVEDDYWHLRRHVQLWDVGCQRQVSVRGPDAARLVQLMTPRDLAGARPGRCLYAPLIDQHAGMLNDPVILVLGADHFWLSIADQDVLLWAAGLALGLALEVTVEEPDVWPLAVQGPQAQALLARVFGADIAALGFFRFVHVDFDGHPLLVARSGFSRQGGFELYLDRPELGTRLWDRLWQAGADLELRAGAPNLVERIEGGLLSYGNEMTRADNPLECGLQRFCRLDGGGEFIGREALLARHREGLQRRIRGLLFGGPRCPPCAATWPVYAADTPAGYITSAAWSPRLQANVALGMLNRDHWQNGQRVAVDCGDGEAHHGDVVALPFPGAVARPGTV